MNLDNVYELPNAYCTHTCVFLSYFEFKGDGEGMSSWGNEYIRKGTSIPNLFEPRKSKRVFSDKCVPYSWHGDS